MKFTGTVVQGNQLGREFGVSTANLDLASKPYLPEGIYFVRVFWQGKMLEGVMHFGRRISVDDQFSIEIHLLDFTGDLYGEILQVEVCRRYRDILKFNTREKLFSKIQEDRVAARKFFLREEILARWKTVSDFERKQMAQRAAEKIASRKDFSSAEIVYAFAPNDSEIPFVERLAKQFSDKMWCFPRVDGGEMHFFPSSFSALKLGKFGILEPEGKLAAPAPDFIFVPALAATKKGDRLGRGAGFYDRFLKSISVPKICVLPEFAVLKTLPALPHDQRVDAVIGI